MQGNISLQYWNDLNVDNIELVYSTMQYNIYTHQSQAGMVVGAKETYLSFFSNVNFHA